MTQCRSVSCLIGKWEVAGAHTECWYSRNVLDHSSAAMPCSSKHQGARPLRLRPNKQAAALKKPSAITECLPS